MITTMCAIVASSVAPSVPHPPPRCIAPPREASDWCVECYTRACSEWIDDFFKCNFDHDCMQFALALYFIKLGICDCGSHHTAVLEAMQESREDALAVLAALNESQTEDALSVLRAWGK